MKYKNITEKDLFVPEVGLIKAGEVVETNLKINNSNFELLVAKAPDKKEEVDKLETNKINK